MDYFHLVSFGTTCFVRFALINLTIICCIFFSPVLHTRIILRINIFYVTFSWGCWLRNELLVGCYYLVVLMKHLKLKTNLYLRDWKWKFIWWLLFFFSMLVHDLNSWVAFKSIITFFKRNHPQVVLFLRIFIYYILHGNFDFLVNG